MWIRSAFWTGTPKAGAEEAFAKAINEELVPAFGNVPAVESAKALWPKRLEDSPPAIYCQVLLKFSTEMDLDRMLASPERLALRSRVREIAAMFDGTISHIDYFVN